MGIVDLTWVCDQASAVDEGHVATLDLTNLVHDQARHTELVPASVLAWWLLSTSFSLGNLRLVLPPAGSIVLRHLARSGILAAAIARNVDCSYPDGTKFELPHLYSDRKLHQPRLANMDWDVLDDIQSGDQLRIIPDLIDPRRYVPEPSTSGLRYVWLAGLRLKSAAISDPGYRRFLIDADGVVGELVDNVHRWSKASRGLAIASTTFGGGKGGESCNRLHVIVMDNGVGIPHALRADLAASTAVAGAAQRGSRDPKSLDDVTLVERLLRYAFGSRELPNHNGHGLNVAQIRAGQWIGAVDVVTSSDRGSAIRVGTRGLGAEFEKQDDFRLPGVSGTLVHVMLQAADSSSSREAAAQSEQVPFQEYDEAVAQAAAAFV